jgi:hypothetical protein
MADIERLLLEAINSDDAVVSDAFAKQSGVDHAAVVGVIMSLLSSELITAKVCRAQHRQCLRAQ